MITANDLYSALLGAPDSGWQEVNVLAAAEELRHFLPMDWQELIDGVLKKPIFWQERCAESAGLAEVEYSSVLLIKLIDSPSMQVAAIAGSELDNMSAQPPHHCRNRLIEVHRYLELQQSPRKDDLKRLLESM